MAAGGSPPVDRVAKKGPQMTHVPDVPPYLSHTNVNNFETSGPKAAKGMRGHKSVDPRNVRGSSNYK